MVTKVAPPSLAGLSSARVCCEELLGWPLLYESERKSLGANWPRGLLLYGPPGCGKTALVHTVAESLGITVHKVSASDIYGAFTGESEKQLREIFEKARTHAATGQPTVLFFDDLDSLAPKRDAHRPHEARVVAQLLTLLDGAASDTGAQGHLTFVGATNDPNSIDPALRRLGRLDQEVAVALPTSEEREGILSIHSRALPLAADINLHEIASKCHGYSGADLAAVTREAALHAMQAAVASTSSPESLDSILKSNFQHLQITQSDFIAALRKVCPSLSRSSDVTLDTVSWHDIGGYEDVKERLHRALEWPIKHAAAFKRLGLHAPRGVLLYGPPGCSKTSLARAAAGASGMRLQVLSGAQLFSMYVGEGEGILRTAFQRSRMTAPSILFIDEIDAIVGGRAQETSSGGGSDASTRILSTLLTEMDGLESSTGVLVLAATNRPHVLDAALLRPGRLDVLLYVPPPDVLGRLDILRVHSRGMPLAEDVDLQALAHRTDTFTGADLASLCQEAALMALREGMDMAHEVNKRHFESALAVARPSLSAAQIRMSEDFRDTRLR
ncbi:g8844 [Coccomyxa elongata]